MIDRQTFGPQTAAYYTLGCKLNFAETSTIGRMLEERGIRRARNGEPVDICIINTCSVTELADKKCRQTIRRISRQHPEAVVVVTGCYAQLKPEEIARIPGVDMVLGAGEKGQNSPIPRQTAKKRRNRHIHHPQSGNRQFRPFMFTRRPHTLLSQSARRLRLFLLILHDTLRPGQKPQWTHRRPCGASP